MRFRMRLVLLGGGDALTSEAAEAGGLDLGPEFYEGDQPWVFFGGNDAEAETPVLWPPHAKS